MDELQNITDIEKLKQHFAALEAVLFVHGEPLSYARIGEILGMKKDDIQALVVAFKNVLEQNEERGLSLIAQGDQVQLVTKSQFGSILERFIKDELKEDLTPAALEALSLVAYLGPLARSELDYVRGVNSAFIVRNLMVRGLIERAPHPERGGSFLYKPSIEFLRLLGIQSTEELPEYTRYHDLLTKSLHEESSTQKEDANKINDII